MSVIELDGVTKRFGDVVAVDDLSLEVEEGEVFGFLGPNGAGKSTTINMMLDFVRPTEGTVRVHGMDAQERSVGVRSRTGVLPEGAAVYDRLTGREHVAFALESKDVHGNPDGLLERVGIGDAADRRAGDYSKGMRQRLTLAMALAGEPDLLIMDEPSTGLDPEGAREMRGIVNEEADRGATVFFSSHILGQVEKVCDRVGILRDGRMVAVDTMDGLREKVGGGGAITVTTGDATAAQVDAVRAMDGVTAAEREGDTVRVSLDGAEKTAVLSTLEDEGVEVIDFQTEEESLEDLFVAYTSGEVEA